MTLKEICNWRLPFLLSTQPRPSFLDVFSANDTDNNSSQQMLRHLYYQPQILFQMKKILSALAAVALTATTAFAAGELIPAGGVYYPTDAINDGCITAQFEDSIAVPSATVTINSVAHNTSVKSVGFTGKVYRVAVDSILNGSAAGTAFTLNVGGLSGNYTYQPTFPLTSVVPAADSALSEKTATIRFNFNTSVNYNGVAIKSGEKVDTIPGAGAGQNIDVALLESYWGTPVNGVNHISVTLLNVAVDGVSISNVSGNPGCIGANYTFTEEAPAATFLGVEEDPYWFLAQDLFGMTITYKFSESVNLDNAKIVVKLINDNGTAIETKEYAKNDMTGDWNMRGNYYGVTIELPSEWLDKYAEFDEESYTWLADFNHMTVTLTGITAQSLNTPYELTYLTSFDEGTMLNSKKKGGAASVNSAVVPENGAFTVYDISGRVVLNNAKMEGLKDLNKGIYIVNGKKIAIK